MDSAERIDLCDPVIVTFLQNKVQDKQDVKTFIAKWTDPIGKQIDEWWHWKVFFTYQLFQT